MSARESGGMQIGFLGVSEFFDCLTEQHVDALIEAAKSGIEAAANALRFIAGFRDGLLGNQRS